MRHESGDVASRIHDSGDRPERAVRVRGVVRTGRPTRRVHVAKQDLAVALKLLERRVVRVEAALAVRDRHAQRSTGVHCVREGCVQPLRGDRDLPADEPHRRVAQEGAGHEASFGQDLETVADAEDETARRRESADRPHDRAESRDDAGTDIVTVGEPAGQDHRRDPVE